MTGRLRTFIQNLRTSYWFIPSVMALLAVLLGAGMLWLDAALGTSWLDGVGWYQQIGVDGAREVLSTIAGSMITVAGVVFSITIVALSFTSSQYGPRVLTNFMSDRGMTVTLGTFIATFLYCLMILRTIRGGENDFVPQLSVIGALLLALCSIGVLIYFIHHVPRTLHVNHVVARIGRQLVKDARSRFPSRHGEERCDPRTPPPPLRPPFIALRAKATGYIQAIDVERLLDVAIGANLVVRLSHAPGEFVIEGQDLLVVETAGLPKQEVEEDLRGCFSFDVKRSPEHDIMFLVSELVEIAARALSPGVNDPMTAVSCLDWLAAGGTEFAVRRLPDPVRLDERGVVRLVADTDDFEHFVEEAFGRLRHYAAADPIAARHFLRTLGTLADVAQGDEQKAALRRQATFLGELVEEQLSGEDRQATLASVRRLEQRLSPASDPS